MHSNEHPDADLRAYWAVAENSKAGAGRTYISRHPSEKGHFMDATYYSSSKSDQINLSMAGRQRFMQ